MAAPIVAPRALSLALWCALALSACSEKKSAAKDRDDGEKSTPSLTMEEKFGLFMKENTELADAVEKESTAAGAVKVWDSRKASLKKRYDAIKDARRNEVSEKTKTAFEENIASCMMKVCMKISLDAAESAAFKKLCDDYTALLMDEASPGAAPGAAPSG